MKSNVCKIEKGTKDLAAILKESEKVAVYNELDAKGAMHLRLICEELDGMLPELVGDFEGNLWIEFAEGVCKVCVSIEIAEISNDRKDQLIKIAKNQKNAATAGIAGKIRAAVESFFLDATLVDSFAMSSGGFSYSTEFYTGADYSYYWSLNQYKNAIKKEEKAEAWDELEKSVIASVADDVVVGIKGRVADIVVVKRFA